MKCQPTSGRCVNCGRSGETDCIAEITVEELAAMEAGEIPQRAVKVFGCQIRYLRGRMGLPGTKLKARLESWGYKDNGKCGCEAFAAQMDFWGCDECERRMPAILDHLRDAAKELGVKYSRFGAWLIVRSAIADARKEAELLS